jgi:hypothetical protein
VVGFDYCNSAVDSAHPEYSPSRLARLVGVWKNWAGSWSFLLFLFIQNYRKKLRYCQTDFVENILTGV